MITEDLGKRIRELRQQTGLSQEKFALKIGMEQTFRPVLTIRIFGEEKCFGPGVAVLLRKVRELHSLRAAAMSIGMAYSKAWTILKNAQQSLGFKLLDSTTGGKHGGGARLTPEGETLLDAYDCYCARLRTYAQELFSETFDGILPL